MSFLAQAMLVVFVAAWGVGVAAWFYSIRYFLPLWWAGINRRERPKGYGLKTLCGVGVFLGAFAVAFSAGGIAGLVGGW